MHKFEKLEKPKGFLRPRGFFFQPLGMIPDAILRLLDELEANRRSRRTAWATLQRLRKLLEANGARIVIPEERNFEREGEAIESGLRRTIEGRDIVKRSLIRAVYRYARNPLGTGANKSFFWAARLIGGQPLYVVHFFVDRMPWGKCPSNGRVCW